MTQEDIQKLVIAEYQKGNVVFLGPDTLDTCPLNEFITQHTDGILYDLNRGEEIVLTFIGDPKWINDYAVAKTIRALKDKIEELQKELAKQRAENDQVTLK